MNISVSMSDGKQILYIVNAGCNGLDKSFAGYGRRDDILKKPITSKICRNIKKCKHTDSRYVRRILHSGPGIFLLLEMEP